MAILEGHADVERVVAGPKLDVTFDPQRSDAEHLRGPRQPELPSELAAIDNVRDGGERRERALDCRVRCLHSNGVGPFG